MQVLWGALFVLAVLVRDAETAGDAAAIDAIASTGMLYVLQKILTEYQVRSRSSCYDDQVPLHPRTTDPCRHHLWCLAAAAWMCDAACSAGRRKVQTQTA